MIFAPMKFSVATRIFFAVCLLFSLAANAQQTPTSGTISGKLMDASNNQPMPFATVALISKQDSKVIKGLQTDVNGDFKLTDIADGTYTVRITFVSYLS